MKCYYEILGVGRDVDEDELKKTYRKLALKWHPDKNLDNLEEAKEQFQLIQQAYEVLSDPHERAWYDNHRDAILKGGIGDDYKDDSIDLFQYFSSSCFKGFGDDKDGFYSVYRLVFEKLAAEDREFRMSDEDSDDFEEAPSFGYSYSNYEDVVHQFYAYWQSYSTKKSFAWLDPYDIRQVPNRRVLRLIEKENKKVRDKAKRERNEQVRNLVSFIRKRDKRVQIYAKKLEEKAKLNAEKAKQFKLQQLINKKKELADYQVSDAYKFSNIESELKTLEANLAAEFGDDLSDSDENDNGLDSNLLHCVACNKIFKTSKAFVNHENSKKHKDNVLLMKNLMKQDEEELFKQDSGSESSTDSEKNNLNETVKAQLDDNPYLFPSGSVDTQDKDENSETSEGELISDDEDDISRKKLNNFKDTRNGIKKDNLKLTKKQKKKQQRKKADSEFNNNPYLFPQSEDTKNSDEDENASEGELISDQEEEMLDKKKKKNRKKQTFNNLNDEEDGEFDFDFGLSKKQRKKRQNVETLVKKRIEDENKEEVKVEKKEETEKVKPKEKKVKDKNLKTSNKKNDTDIDVKNSCVKCKEQFSSKNRLFDHLKKTGHATYLPESVKSKVKTERKTKSKLKVDSDSE